MFFFVCIYDFIFLNHGGVLYRSAVIGCTLWDSYYFKFMSNWRRDLDSYILVVMLT